MLLQELHNSFAMLILAAVRSLSVGQTVDGRAAGRPRREAVGQGVDADESSASDELVASVEVDDERNDRSGAGDGGLGLASGFAGVGRTQTQAAKHTCRGC